MVLDFEKTLTEKQKEQVLYVFWLIVIISFWLFWPLALLELIVAGIFLYNYLGVNKVVEKYVSKEKRNNTETK